MLDIKEVFGICHGAFFKGFVGSCLCALVCSCEAAQPGLRDSV